MVVESVVKVRLQTSPHTLLTPVMIRILLKLFTWNLNTTIEILRGDWWKFKRMSKTGLGKSGMTIELIPTLTAK